MGPGGSSGDGRGKETGNGHAGEGKERFKARASRWGVLIRVVASKVRETVGLAIGAFIRRGSVVYLCVIASQHVLHLAFHHSSHWQGGKRRVCAPMPLFAMEAGREPAYARISEMLIGQHH